MSGLVSRSPQVDLLWVRLVVLVAAGAGISTLVVSGQAPVAAATITGASLVGGVAVGRQLTLPYVAPPISVLVLLLVLGAVVAGVAIGYPALECVGVVLTGGWGLADVVRRLTGAIVQPAATHSDQL